MGFVWKLPRSVAIAIMAVCLVVMVGAVGYVFAHVSDAKFMFLVAIVAVGLGGTFGGLTLGFLLGYLQESPASRQRMEGLRDEIERLNQSNKKLRVALAEFAQRDLAPMPTERREFLAPPPEEPRVVSSSRGDSRSLTIDLPRLLDSVRDWVQTPKTRPAEPPPASLPNGSSSADTSTETSR